VLALLLVAVALGVSNLAAAVGLGVQGGVSRVRVAVVFGVFEAGMPVLGLLLGRQLATSSGPAAHWAGGGLLTAVGVYTLVQAARGQAPAEAGTGLGRLVLTAFALSIDNLAAGFALGTYHVGLAVAAVVIGLVSVAMSLAGLEMGTLISSRWTGRGEIAAGAILTVVGLTILVAGT
jgi:manganese efflux pump family protein